MLFGLSRSVLYRPPRCVCFWFVRRSHFVVSLFIVFFLIWNIFHTNRSHPKYKAFIHYECTLITKTWNCTQITRRVIFCSIEIFKYPNGMYGIFHCRYSKMFNSFGMDFWECYSLSLSRAPNGIINFLFLGIRTTWNSTFGKTECDTLRVQASQVVSSQRLPCFHCFGTFVCNCLSLWRRTCSLCSSYIVDFIGIFMNSISTKEHAKCTTISCSPT